MKVLFLCYGISLFNFGKIKWVTDVEITLFQKEYRALELVCCKSNIKIPLII